MKLIGIHTSAHNGKKLCAEFLLDNGKTKYVNFGAKGYRDYTTIEDPNEAKIVRERYWNRHMKEYGQEPDTPGMLSLFILWGWYQDKDKNLLRYKKIYNL